MNEVYTKLGKLLKLERERRKLTLTTVSEELKISETNLEYIEAGDRESLPSELYFDLFAKSYAELLGIDYAKTLEAIREDIGEPLETEVSLDDEEKAPSPKKARRRKRKPETGEEGVEEGEEEEEEREEGEGLSRKLIWLFSGVIGAFVIFIVFYAVFLAGDKTPPPGAPGETASEEGAGGVTAAQKAEFASYDWSTPKYTPPSPLTLKLISREESWSTVVADGDTSLFRTLIPGRPYTVEAKYRLKVSIAHPAVVQVTLNGQPVNLRDPETRRISRVEINQANVNEFLNAPLEETSQSPTAAPSRPRTQTANQSVETTPAAGDTATTDTGNAHEET